ncbi:MAG: L,D-transpeptidase [Actinomycetota bacterium]
MRASTLPVVLAAAATLMAACGASVDESGDPVTAAESTVRIEIADAPTTLPPPPTAEAAEIVVATTGPGSSAPGDGDGGDGAAADPSDEPVETPTTASGQATGTASTSGTVAETTTVPPGPAPPAGDASPSVVAQAVVSSVTARVAPAEDADEVTTLAHPTPVGSPLVFRAVPGGSAVAEWIEVQLPIQPNGTTGWVKRDDVTLFENPYRIEVDRASHRLRVYHLGDLWVDTVIAVGTGATPTPVGEFYLLELLAPPDPTGPYGPYAFGLSGFSEVLDSFGGADTAIIGLHGTDEPEALGTDVSFGCIRLANDVMEQLATTLPLGTPVVIT